MNAHLEPLLRRRLNSALMIACGAFLTGTAWVLITCGGSRPLSRPESSPQERADGSAVQLSAYPRAPTLDDNASRLVWQYYFTARIEDPLSLEHIRDCFYHAGHRAIQDFEQELAAGRLSFPQQLDRRADIARLYLYEGDARKAAEVLADIRALVQQDPETFRKGLPTLIFLQGIAALRRAEAENCVQCQCEGSCIFPIPRDAVHQNRAGSKDAIRFFAEYLQILPDDDGVRWLLNVAYMTLGEYPDGVPPQYLIPPRVFESQADIGRFTDIAPLLGVDRLDLSGGAIMDDFDNDGLLDIVETSTDPGTPMALYRNRGNGTFEERGRAAGLSSQLGGLYCVQTDYNNDGRLDIYVCRGAWTQTPQRHSLLRNNGDGTFTDVTKEAGLLTPVDGQVAVWADYDNDGWLDLFVGGETVPSRLYRNRGDGTFEEVALTAGVANEGFACKGANWGDFNGDGYPDLLVSNINGPPRLFRNNRDGTFTDVAAEMGIRQPAMNGFSCWFWDYDNDGWPDIFIAGYELALTSVIRSYLKQPSDGTSCRLYRNRGGRGFDDVTKAVGLDELMPVMGSNFADFDNDGFLDIYLGTGGQQYAMLVPNRMFKNVEGRHFVDITTSSGTGHLQKGHAIACGDWDRDGNVDLYVQLGGAVPGDAFRNVLFQNPGGHGNHSITVKLIGKKTNRAAIGARIKITPQKCSPTAIYRHITSGSSFGGNPLQQTIGVGKVKQLATLEVYWPTSRTTQVFHDVPADQAIEITEFEEKYRPLKYTLLPKPRPAAKVTR